MYLAFWLVLILVSGIAGLIVMTEFPNLKIGIALLVISLSSGILVIHAAISSPESTPICFETEVEAETFVSQTDPTNSMQMAFAPGCPSVFENNNDDKGGLKGKIRFMEGGLRVYMSELFPSMKIKRIRVVVYSNRKNFVDFPNVLKIYPVLEEKAERMVY